MNGVLISLYDIPLALVFLLVLVLLGAAIEIGYRRGTRSNESVGVESLLELIPTSLLGLLALLLGFTFSMSIARFDARKLAMVREANAVETLWLRLNALPKAQNTLLNYLDERIAFPGEPTARLAVLKTQLWQMAQEQVQREPNAITALTLESLNSTFDLGTERQFAIHDHVPEVA
jgi:hypothetical protein